ncbi:MAG TPA: MarR family transcriptional regulator [Acidobacteriota bacterium]|nr:MarR family transcriptional regulator [Acidobacteriota bacterium]
MSESSGLDLIATFLGSANIFMFAVNDVFEERLLKQAISGQLTVSQAKLLKLVSLSDAQTVGDVAAFLGISNAAASKAVDKLVRRNLMRRREGETDRRSIHLSLSDLGRNLLDTYDAVRQRKLEEIFGQVPPDELRKAAEFLNRLSTLIVDHSAKAEEICLQCGMYFPERCLLQELEGRDCYYSKRRSRRDSRATAADNA